MVVCTNADYDAWSALAPAYKIYKWMGLAQFNVNGPKGKRQITLINFTSPYKIVFCVFIFSVAFLTVVNDTHFFNFKMYTTLQKYIIKFETGTAVLIMLVLVISNITVYKPLINCLKTVLEVDKSFSKYGTSVNNESTRHIAIFSIAFYLPFLTVGYVFAFMMYKNNMEVWARNILYLVTNLYKLGLGVVYKSWVHLIKERFEALNRELRSYSKACVKGNLVNQLNIEDVVTIYNRLYFTTKTLKNCSVMQLLIGLTSNFLLLTTHAYHLYTVIYHKTAIEDGTMMFASFCIVVYGTETITVIYFFNQLQRQVSITLFYGTC